MELFFSYLSLAALAGFAVLMVRRTGARAACALCGAVRHDGLV